MSIDIDWGEPHSGRGRDEIRLNPNDPDELRVSSVLTMDAGPAPVKVNTVYRRQR